MARLTQVMPSDDMSFETDPDPRVTVLAVSALNRLARQAIEAGLPLLWVSGEISNLTFAASGHLYFSLKDESAQVRCVMFRNRAALLPFRPASGAHVEVRALATLYEPRGEFQLDVESIRRAGVGALYEAFERLKARLESEGLFDAARRRMLPRFPRRIGVITSLQAAALRDVLATLARRAPHLPVIVYPTPVQGEEAPRGIVAALGQAASRAECDVLILARGGGSIEDLRAFNDESVARAIAACPLPVVSGVGHETDTTIADLVADERAATPTAAAERVSATWLEARARLRLNSQRAHAAMRRGLERAMQRTDLAAHRLISPAERLHRLRLSTGQLALRLHAGWHAAQRERHHALDRSRLRLASSRPDVAAAAQRLHGIDRRLALACRAWIERRRRELRALAVNLAHLDPKAALARGYAIVRTGDGRIVRDAATLVRGQPVELQFAAGRAEASVLRTREG